MSHYIALFDWDKTVRKNYACLMWLDMLVESKIVNANLLKENSEVYHKYLDGLIDHNELAKKGIEIYSKYIQDVKKEDLIPVLKEYQKRDEGNIFPIMKEYIFPFLHKNHIKTVIISGAQQELIELYKEELKIDKIYGVEFETKEGKYTNHYMNSGESKNKEIMVNKIKQENDILFSFGDSISDIPLLQVAKKGFVNNTKDRFIKQSSVSYYDFIKIENGKKIVKEMEEILKGKNNK